MSRSKHIFLNPTVASVDEYIKGYLPKSGTWFQGLEEGAVLNGFGEAKEAVGVLGLKVAKTVGDVHVSANVLAGINGILVKLDNNVSSLIIDLIDARTSDAVDEIVSSDTWSALGRDNRLQVLEILLVAYKLVLDCVDNTEMRHSILDAGVAFRERAFSKNEFRMCEVDALLLIDYKLYEPYMDKQQCFGIYSTRLSSCRRAFERLGADRSKPDTWYQKVLEVLPAMPGVFMYYFSWAQSWENYPSIKKLRLYESKCEHGLLKLDVAAETKVIEVLQNNWFSGNRYHNNEKVLSDFVLSPYVVQNPWWYGAVVLPDIVENDAFKLWAQTKGSGEYRESAKKMVALLTCKNSEVYDVIKDPVELACLLEDYYTHRGMSFFLTEAMETRDAASVSSELDVSTGKGTTELKPFINPEWSSGSIFSLTNWSPNDTVVPTPPDAARTDSTDSSFESLEKYKNTSYSFQSLLDDCLSENLKTKICH